MDRANDESTEDLIERAESMIRANMSQNIPETSTSVSNISDWIDELNALESCTDNNPTTATTEQNIDPGPTSTTASNIQSKCVSECRVNGIM